jgi:hypothetical protein
LADVKPKDFHLHSPLGAGRLEEAGKERQVVAVFLDNLRQRNVCNQHSDSHLVFEMKQFSRPKKGILLEIKE